MVWCALKTESISITHLDNFLLPHLCAHTCAWTETLDHEQPVIKETRGQSKTPPQNTHYGSSHIIGKGVEMQLLQWRGLVGTRSV